jgi:hypothetical protein
LSRTKYLPRTCKKNRHVRIEPLGYMSATDYVLVVSPASLLSFGEKKKRRVTFSVCEHRQ